jgi:glycosyltransferase involved in cell wall biosynthesis
VTAAHFVVPDGIDDPSRPTGGNAYDRHVAHGLALHEHAVPGFWRPPDAESFAALEAVLQQIPDGSGVLIDGLIASTAPEVLVPQSRRLRVVVLVHMPLADEREAAVLSAASSVIATSEWSRRRLLELYGLAAERVHVAVPGVEPAELASGTGTGGALLCVAAVTPGKGHDLLIEALATITDLPWHCECVGSLERDPAFVESLRSLGRVSFTGPRTGAELDRSYAAADLLVLPSRGETFGMTVIEALARGVPVVATNVGGVPEALGFGADGSRPGLLVAPEDPEALAGALRSWLGDAELRDRLRQAARERRDSLPTWSATTSVIAEVLR